MRPWRQLDHTSDLKVEIRGRDLAGLFENTCRCVFDLMLDPARLRETRAVHVALESDDLSELLLDWVRELLFRFSTEGLAVARVSQLSITTGTPCILSARLHGDSFDPARHGPKLEIKTPTYHDYALEETTEGYEVTLVLDV